MGYVDQSVVVIFAVAEVGGDVAEGVSFSRSCLFQGRRDGDEHMIDPNIGRGLYADGVTVACEYFLTDNVSYNNVGGFVDVKTDSNEC